MTWSRPLTKANTKRLFGICSVVREHLGLGKIGTEYRFKRRPADGDKDCFAASFIFRAGWRCLIEFYDPFFMRPLWCQLETIVHEHLHVAMQPFDQALNRMEDMILKRDRPIYYENIHVSREIVVDRLAHPILKLLEPHLRKVL